VTKHRVADLNDIAVGELKRVDVDGVLICLARLDDDAVCAINDTCTHEYTSLSDGELYQGSVSCPLHGSLFDVRTGKVTGMPADIPVATYKVSVDDGGIFVEV
jgi:3-phenylpropionate/trans-cinnamate dioxygenase ferredoxin subunit